VTEGACPSCGAPVRFTAGTAQVLICAHCHTVVARAGAALEARGKVAAIVDTDSPLQLGVSGRFEHKPFRVVGHLQKDFGAGPWDEWYVELDGGELAWLSESEGEWHWMFSAGEEGELRFADLHPTQTVHLGGVRPFTIEEVGHSTILAAEGELPSDVHAGAKEKYADCTSAQGGFATLDFGARDRGAEVFLGKRVELGAIGISPDQLRPRAHKAALLQARCTQCNGPLDLRAPDKTQRVACPFCGALLDASQGKLRFLQALGKPDVEPLIPLGAKGVLDGVEWICIAFLVRHCDVEGTRYLWTEALLFNRAHGFSWLVESEGHWEFLKPIAAGDVTEAGKSLIHAGKRYRRFQGAEAVTDFVLGECYWAVSQGETTRAEEFVDPPATISREMSGNEVTYTAGHYVERAVLEKAFGLKGLPSSKGIAPAQPNPFRRRAREDMTWFAVYALAIAALFVVASTMSAREIVLDEAIDLPPGMAAGAPESMHFSPPFTLRHAANLEVSVSASPLSNDWLGLDLDLVNDETGDVTSVYEELSYYSGVDSDGAWSEGSTSATDYVSRVDPGQYVLRVTPSFDGAQTRSPRQYTVRLRSDVPRFWWAFVALLCLAALPLLNQFRAGRFEHRRWEEAS
jgi:uncharacterized Zn finger protein (UPF0148 family)